MSDTLLIIVSAVLGALPTAALSVWAMVKAYAASSAAKWDDEAIALVEKIAKGVVDKASAPLTGVDH